MGVLSTVGSVNTGVSNVDNLPDGIENKASFSVLTPQLGVDFTNSLLSSVYLNVPTYWDSSSADSSSSRTIGRPEIGVTKTVFESRQTEIEAGLALRLPFYDDSAGYYVEGNRVFQIAPSLNVDVRVGHSKFHILVGTKLTYDTKASVALPYESEEGDALKSSALERPFALRGNVGIEYEARKLTFGLGVRNTTWLGSGKVTDNDSVIREVMPLDLLWGELSAVYELYESTKLSLNVTRGIKTRNDFYSLVQEDAPEEVADGTMSLGLVQTF